MNPDAAAAAKGTTLANMTNSNSAAATAGNNSKHCSLHHHGHASHVHYRRRSNTLESASRLIEKRKPKTLGHSVPECISEIPPQILINTTKFFPAFFKRAIVAKLVVSDKMI